MFTAAYDDTTSMMKLIPGNDGSGMPAPLDPGPLPFPVPPLPWPAATFTDATIEGDI
jgi:hypothetical protein